MKTLSLGIVIGASLGASFNKSFQSTTEKIGALSKSIASTNIKFQATKDVIKYQKLLKTLRDKQKILGTSNKQLARGIKDVEKRYKQSKQAAKSYGIQIGQVVAQNNKLERSLHQLARKQKRLQNLEKSKQRLSNAKGSFLGLLGVGYAAHRIGQNAITHDDATIRLKTVVDPKSFEKAKQFARDYSKTHLGTETQIINIQYALNSAGLSADAAMIGATVVEKVAKVTGGVGESVGEIIGIVYNNMAGSIEGKTKEKLERIGDVLTQTQLKFQIRDFSQLGESMAKGAKGAIKYKVGLEQTAAALGQLNTSGVQGSLAGTAFNAILRQMSKAADELGFSIVRGANGNMDFIQTIKNLKQSISFTDDIDERAGIIQDAFGDEGGAISILIDNLGKLESNFQYVAKSQGVVNKNYDYFLKGKGAPLRQFAKNMQLVGTAFAETLLPPMNAVLKPLGKIAVWTAEAAQNYPVITKLIGGISTGFILYKAGALLAAAASWAFNAALVANPIGLIVAGIVTAATLIYTYWEPIAGFFKKLWNGIKNTFSSGFAWIGKTIKSMTSWLPDWLVGNDDSNQSSNKLHQAAKSVAKSSSIKNTNTTNHLNAPITIHAAPGMNTQQLANQVQNSISQPFSDLNNTQLDDPDL